MLSLGPIDESHLSEGELSTPSLGRCRTRCLSPKLPLPEQLTCFAGFWSPSDFNCIAAEVQEEVTCSVPAGIPEANDPPCQGFEETLPPGAACAPRCISGHVPTEAVLACENYTDDLIPGGRRCTAACTEGFRATANLTCLLGRLLPSRFACVDASITDSGGDAADDFWGSAGGGATLAPTTAPATTVSERPAVTEAPPESGVLETLLSIVESELFVIIAASSGGACGLCCLIAGVLLLLRRRRRRKASTDKVESSWEEVSELAHSFREHESPDSARSTGSRQSRRLRKATSDRSLKAESQATSIVDDEVAADALSMDGLEGPEEVKEVLRLISRPEHEGVAPPVSKEFPPKMAAGLVFQFVSAASVKDRHRRLQKEELDEEPELIRIAQEAAREAEKEQTPADLLHFAKRIASEDGWMLSELAFSFYPSQEQATSARLVSAKRDARFEAMDRELGEAVAEAATASPFRRKGNSSAQIEAGLSVASSEQRARQAVAAAQAAAQASPASTRFVCQSPLSPTQPVTLILKPPGRCARLREAVWNAKLDVVSAGFIYSTLNLKEAFRQGRRILASFQWQQMSLISLGLASFICLLIALGGSAGVQPFAAALAALLGWLVVYAYQLQVQCQRLVVSLALIKHRVARAAGTHVESEIDARLEADLTSVSSAYAPGALPFPAFGSALRGRFDWGFQ
eukprot:s1433_g12.t1